LTSARAPPQTPLGELTALPKPPSWIQGVLFLREGERKKKKGEGEREKKRGGRKRRNQGIFRSPLVEA